MKVAIFGVWHVHASGYTKTAMEFCEVVGFYERDETLAKDFADKFDIPHFKTAEELLASDAEGVIVCSASCDHVEDIIKIANAGKHIFTEKVLALTDADCERIEKAVEKNGVNFTISLFQKYLGSRIAVKEIASSGELGKLNYMRFRNCHSGSTRNWLPKHFYNAEQCGGGAMIDLGAHGMYLTEWILGMPAKVSSAFTLGSFDVTHQIFSPFLQIGDRNISHDISAVNKNCTADEARNLFNQMCGQKHRFMRFKNPKQDLVKILSIEYVISRKRLIHQNIICTLAE